MKYNEQFDLYLHKDDKWLDEVRLLSDDKPFLRLITMPRWKTSELSGNEWMVSCGWQANYRYAELVQGDCDPWRKDANWFSFDTGYNGGLETGCAGLYPGIYSSQPKMMGERVSAVEFVRKNRVLYRSSYDGKSLLLLHAAGHLPWALINAKDQPLGTDEAWDDTKKLCFQAGCAEEASATYRLKALYDRNGNRRDANKERISLSGRAHVRLVRRFCPKHLTRGDCGLEDADLNYETVSVQRDTEWWP